MSISIELSDWEEVEFLSRTGDYDHDSLVRAEIGGRFYTAVGSYSGYELIKVENVERV